MLAQILPGFREIRGPLASGFLWLLLGYLIFHGDVVNAHGKVKEIDELGEKLNPAALAAVASFAAYLLGSLSEDLFKRVLMVAVSLAPTAGAPVDVGVHENVVLTEEMTESFRETQVVRLENEADRFDAERELRLAILPPALALIIYLAFDERAWWWFGLVFVAGLSAQVWLRTRDWVVARDSLFSLRRQVGVPPASAAEAEAAESAASEPNIKLWILNHVRKGKKFLSNWQGTPDELIDAWADEAATFLREHAQVEDAARFLEVSVNNPRGNVEAQIAALQNIALAY